MKDHQEEPLVKANKTRAKIIKISVAVNKMEDRIIINKEIEEEPTLPTRIITILTIRTQATKSQTLHLDAAVKTLITKVKEEVQTRIQPTAAWNVKAPRKSLKKKYIIIC